MGLPTSSQYNDCLESEGFPCAREPQARVTQAAGKWSVTQQLWKPWIASGHGRDNQAYGRQPVPALTRQLLSTLPKQMNNVTRAGWWVHSAHGRQIGRMDAHPTWGLRSVRCWSRWYSLTRHGRRSFRCFPLTGRRGETGPNQNKNIMISSEYGIEFDGERIQAWRKKKAWRQR